jgi:accessory gene regulator B
MKKNLTHRIAVKIADSLNKYSPKEGIAYKKIVYGTEVILINIIKTTIIMTVAAILGVLPQTIFVMLGFNALRQTAFGVHALTNIGCILSSIVLFVLAPFLLRGFEATPLMIAIVFAFILAAMCLYAPADTKARPLVNAKQRKRFKKISIAICLVLAVVLMLSPFREINLVVMLGATYSAVFVLPITYKLLKREVNNYERYNELLRHNHEFST